MTTLAVALLSTALASGSGGSAFVANPRHNTGCRDANDCGGLSVYCYRGKPNYCSYGNGVGSICRDQSGCGWLGHGTNARKMRCVEENWRKLAKADRRAETDETAQLARPRPPARRVCEDPWGREKNDQKRDDQRRLDGQTNQGGQQAGAISEANFRPPIPVFEANQGQQAGAISEANVVDHGAQQLVNPRSNTGCRDANDCRGLSVYCYRRSHGNKCVYGNGIGSICRDQSGCGWLGFGDHARKMHCYFGEHRREHRRAETGQTAQLARPRPPSSGRCVDPWHRMP